MGVSRNLQVQRFRAIEGTTQQEASVVAILYCVAYGASYNELGPFSGFGAKAWRDSAQSDV